jgi:hypothetical protein
MNMSEDNMVHEEAMRCNVAIAYTMRRIVIIADAGIQCNICIYYETHCCTCRYQETRCDT